MIGAGLGFVAGVGLALLGTSQATTEAPGAGIAVLSLAGIVGGTIGGVIGAKTAPREWVPATVPPSVGAASSAADRGTAGGAPLF